MKVKPASNQKAYEQEYNKNLKKADQLYEEFLILEKNAKTKIELEKIKQIEITICKLSLCYEEHRKSLYKVEKYSPEQCFKMIQDLVKLFEEDIQDYKLFKEIERHNLNTYRKESK